MDKDSNWIRFVEIRIMFQLDATRVYIRNFDRTLFIFTVLLTQRPVLFPRFAGGEEVAIVPVEYIQ